MICIKAIVNKFNNWYDSLKEPLRFMVALVLITPVIIAINFEYDLVALIYFALIVLVRSIGQG